MRPLTIVLICLLPIGAILGTVGGHWIGDYGSYLRSKDLRGLEEKNREELEAFTHHLEVEREAANRRDREHVAKLNQRIRDEQRLRDDFESERLIMQAELNRAEQLLKQEPSQETMNNFTLQNQQYAVFLQQEVDRRKPFDQWYNKLTTDLEALGVLHND